MTKLINISFPQNWKFRLLAYISYPKCFTGTNITNVTIITNITLITINKSDHEIIIQKGWWEDFPVSMWEFVRDQAGLWAACAAKKKQWILPYNP